MDIPASIIERLGISRGAILHSDIFEDIDHGKFFVIVGVSEDRVAGYFFINSKIHPAIQSKPEQLAMQCHMKRSDYPFLRYDSFLSAVNVVEIACERLASTMKSGHTTIVGQMRDEHMNHLLETCRNSRLFSRKVKEKYFK